MKEKKQIVFATGSRADYGIMRRYLTLLNLDEDISLSIVATGALLSEQYGHQVDLIYKDGFDVNAELPLPLNVSSNEGVIHAMAHAMDAFALHFAKTKIDLLIILGDRYEMLSVAIAAAMQRIPILHVHGGEATFGNYDEFIRHSITKMSAYHFTSTEVYRQRVIQLGENPRRVFNLGALGAENCLDIDIKNVPEVVAKLSAETYFVVLFHPETLTDMDMTRQVDCLLAAISGFGGYQFIFLGTNADTHSDVIRKKISEFVDRTEDALYFENLHTDAYHYLLQHSICLIGNSSSGIIEAPSLGIYTINIGARQKGRVRGKSVVDVNCEEAEITNAIKQILASTPNPFPKNPYYQENSAEKYYQTTKEILRNLKSDMQEPKQFFDLERHEWHENSL